MGLFVDDNIRELTNASLVQLVNEDRLHRAFFCGQAVLANREIKICPLFLHGEHCSAGWCCNSGHSIAVEHYVSLQNFVIIFDRELEHVSFTFDTIVLAA